MNGYRARHIGYEEGHEETDFEDCDGLLVPRYHWVEDFYIRLDMQAFRIGNRKIGINIFWADFICPKRWRALRGSIRATWKILCEQMG